MKKINYLLAALIALGFASCSIEKRTFRPGYHIEWKTALKKDHSSFNKSEDENATTQSKSNEPSETVITTSAEILKEDVSESLSQENLKTNPITSESNHASISTDRSERKRIRLAEKTISNELRSNHAQTFPQANVSPFPMEQNNQSVSSADQVVEIILAIFIPPLGVYLHEDSITTNFWISLILTLLFWLPGSIFSVLVVLDLI